MNGSCTVDDVYGATIALPLALKARSPLPLVIPRMFGYVEPRCIQRLRFTDQAPEHYQVRAGYPYEGPVPQSRLREDHC